MSKRNHTNPEEVKNMEETNNVEIIDAEPIEEPEKTDKRKKLLLIGGIAATALASGIVGMLFGKHCGSNASVNWDYDEEEESDDDEESDSDLTEAEGGTED